MKFIAVVIALLTISGGAFAQSAALLLDKMPVGLKIHYKNSEGEKRVDTFLGRKGKGYQFSTLVSGRRSTNFSARQLFDLQGRRLKWTGNARFREKWKPYDCVYQIGICKVKHSNNYGGGGRWIHKTSLKGRTLTMVRRRPNEDKFRRAWVSKLGKYNLRMLTEIRSSDGAKVTYWRKIIKIEQP